MTLLQSRTSLAALSAALLITAGSVGYADNSQGNNNNQDDRFNQLTDSGDKAHVLPTPDVLLGKSGATATIAPKNKPGQASVYPASYGSGNLINHGGPEIPTAHYFAVYWNQSVSDSKEAGLGYGSVSAQIQSFVQNFGSGVSDYSIIQQYGATNPIASTLAYDGSFVDSKATQSSISDSSIRSWLKGLFNNHMLTPSANTLYGLYFPARMRVSLNFFQASCTSFCGYHSSFTYNSVVIKYAVYPYLNCTGCSMAGKAVGDMLTIVSSHEIREAVTDPQGTAWYDSAGDEADDKCVWHNLYQMASGGFWVQPEFSNAGIPGDSTPGCVVP